MKIKKALITGISGQDGSYLAEFLLSKGYQVHGIVRHVALEDPDHRLWRIKHLSNGLKLYPCSLESYPNLAAIIEKVEPDECYHLAAQSFVGYSFENGFASMSPDINATQFVLSALTKKAPNCRFYFAGSSEMYGAAKKTPQDEDTPFNPRSPYGIAKVAGFHLTQNYRNSYGLFACSGICFNHESPRRGYEFVSRKITKAAARIKAGLESELRLGNLEAKRDWGFSGDYVKAMWLMLQQEKPDDYVIATGETHSVKDFLRLAFEIAGLDWHKYVVVDEEFYRPSELVELRGDSGKARRKLSWLPEVGFKRLVELMMASELELLLTLKGE